MVLHLIVSRAEVNGLKDSVTSLIDGRVRPGLGQTIEEVVDVGLHGLLAGGVVNPLLDGLVAFGQLVENCLDMVLQSWEIFYSRELSNL